MGENPVEKDATWLEKLFGSDDGNNNAKTNNNRNERSNNNANSSNNYNNEQQLLKQGKIIENLMVQSNVLSIEDKK